MKKNKTRIFIKNEGYYLHLAYKTCEMRYYQNDMVWLPRYYSLCVAPAMSGWSTHEKERYLSHPLYRDIPILEYHKQDVEIAAVLAAWTNFGRKTTMPSKCAALKRILTEHPYQSLMWQDYKYWRYDVLEPCFSRYIYQDLLDLYDRLWRIYRKHKDLETAVEFAMRKKQVDHVQAILLLFEGVNGFRPNNPDTLFRINMMYRWLTLSYRVDIGIWHVVNPRDLHVSLRASDIKKLPNLSAFKNLTLSSKNFQEVVDNAARAYFPRCPAVMDYIIKWKTTPGLSAKTNFQFNVAVKSYSNFLTKLTGNGSNGKDSTYTYRRIKEFQ